MKSPLVKIIIKIAATVIAIAAIFYFVFSPRLSELAQNQIEVSQLNNDLQAAETKLKALKTFEKNRSDLDSTKKQVLSLLPDDASASSFILNIEQTSSNIGIIVDSLSVNAVKSSTTAKKTEASEDTAKSTTSKAPAEKALTFSASITSDYDKTQQFLKSMQFLTRFNTIESITLSGYNKESGNISLKTDGKVYYGR